MNLYIFEIKGNPSYKIRYGVTYAVNQNDALEQIMQSMTNESTEIRVNGFGFIYQEIGQFLSVDFPYEQEPETVICQTQTALVQYLKHINRLERKCLKKLKRQSRSLRLTKKMTSLRLMFVKNELQIAKIEHENMN